MRRNCRLDGRARSGHAYGSYGRGDHMIWETPTFVEIDMNAEIGAYDGDYDGI